MVLFNIAKKNIEKNLKGYFLYFFSIVFTVGIYYAFKNLQYNPSIDSALSASSKASTAFNSASFIIALFSVLFIWYSNSFFIKKRKKEIGLYALLGIENKEIGLLLFFETLIIGTAALIIGIIAGIIFSKLMLMILLKLIGLNLTIVFTISFKGIFDTFILFMIIFLVIAYQSNRIIYKFKLIELFKASSVSEKGSKGSKLKATMSIILIGFGYINYLSVLKGMDLIIAAMVTLVAVVVGTFLFFGSFMYFFIKKKKKNERSYYKGLNMISISQLLYRIKSNARMLSIISILSATTLTAIGVSISTYFMSSQSVDESAPFSYTLKMDNKNYIREFEEKLNKSTNHKLIDKAEFTYITKESSDKNDFGYFDEYEVISISNLNKLLKLKDKNTVERIGDNEFIHIYPKENDFSHIDSIDIKNNDNNINLKLKSDLDEKLYNSMAPQNTIVVSDGMFKELESNNKLNNYYIYNISNQKDGEKFDRIVSDLTEKYAVGDYKKSVDSLVDSYYITFKDAFTTSGIMVFIGVFVGLVFLVCTGSVIFFKLLSEAHDEAPRYNILEKVGVDKGDIKLTVYKQVGVNFFVPLLVGSIHSIVANYVVCNMLGQNIAMVMGWTLIPYSIIYIIYYIITSKFYFDIVTKNN
ncbi:peptide ABC transporter permease,FtsX-like permease family [[Clostridium] sordellii]|uniref:ABC transporter permease n=1 Tax=Paraclostridium sordellii TaxID=1505 RepID=UPI000543F9B5|nr:FtsX-like permease family protein [Paeniclostridium sordellii]CEK35819.1 peptide ABC transporter permease,FtsX-like permease family [[Clostridium] sordellii] [Paeniclostridium sordellii]